MVSPLSSPTEMLTTGLTLAMLTAFAQVPHRPAPTDSTFRVEPIVFISDRGDSIPAERGHLMVPEDRTVRSSRFIELTFIRFRSTAARVSAPIVYLAGGPGASGELAGQGRRFPVFQRLRDAADVILFNQRGTFGANPLPCPDVASHPDSQPWTEAMYLDRYRQWSRSCVQRWTQHGVSLAAYNAGASRVTRWLARPGTDDAELFTEWIPFTETRDYVRIVLRNASIYRNIYGGVLGVEAKN